MKSHVADAGLRSPRSRCRCWSTALGATRRLQFPAVEDVRRRRARADHPCPRRASTSRCCWHSPSSRWAGCFMRKSLRASRCASRDSHLRGELRRHFHETHRWAGMLIGWRVRRTCRRSPRSPGPLGQLLPSVSPGYGFAAIIVAFVGRLHPVGIVFASLLMVSSVPRRRVRGRSTLRCPQRSPASSRARCCSFCWRPTSHQLSRAHHSVPRRAGFPA